MSEPYPIATLQRPPTPWYDLDRLQQLRDEFAKVRGEAHRAADSLREAQQAFAQDRANLAIGPKAEPLRSLSTADLSRLSVEQLNEVQINPLAVQRLLVSERRVSTLSAAADAANARVNRSAPFMEKLEAFARARNL